MYDRDGTWEGGIVEGGKHGQGTVWLSDFVFGFLGVD